MNLKGQNFRILYLDNDKFKVIGMATNCQITLNNNTEEAGHKDIVGMAAVPTVVSQSWSVQVDSLNVTDVETMLTAIKNLTQFTLMWDETSTSDNQTGAGASFSRVGKAYLTDATFTFDNRTNSTKSLQFVGIGGIENDTHVYYEAIAVGSYTKGQFVRLFLSNNNSAAPSKVIAAAKTLSLHVAMQLEDSTTKDTAGGDWTIQEPVALNFDISTTALVRSGETITSSVAGQGLSELETIFEGAVPVKFKIANASGDNNRTAGAVICSGSCLIQSLTLNGANKANADYTASLIGYGAYVVGA